MASVNDDPVGEPLSQAQLSHIERVLRKLFSQRWEPIVEDCVRLGLPLTGALSPKKLPELSQAEMDWVRLFVSASIQDVGQDVASGAAQDIVTAVLHPFPPLRLASKLRERFLSTEGCSQLDWREIALTGILRLSETGRLSLVPDKELVLGRSYRNACDDCRRLVHGRVFRKIAPPAETTPKLRQTSIWVGKSNTGASRTNWEACVSMHPECRCYFARLNPERWWVSDDGRMQPRVGQEAAYRRWRESQWFDREQEDDTTTVRL